MKATIKTSVWATELSGKHCYLSDNDMEPHGWVKVCDVEVEYEQPTPDQLRSKLVNSLRKKLDGVRASNYLAEQAIQNQIQELMCIEHKEEA